MKDPPLVSRSLAATSLFFYVASWSLLLVGTPLLIEKLLPPGHPRLGALDMLRFTTFVVLFNGTFAFVGALVAGRIAHGNRFMIGAVGLSALVVSYQLLEGARLPWPGEEQTAVSTLRLWHIMLFTAIGLLLMTCSVLLTWRKVKHGKSIHHSHSSC